MIKTEKFPLTVSEQGVRAKVRKITQAKNGHEYVFYSAEYVLLGKRKQEWFTHLADAKKAASDACKKIASGQQQVLQLTSLDRLVYLRATESLKPSQIPLDVAASEFAQAYSILGGRASLTEAARDYIARHSTAQVKIMLSDAVKRLVEQAKSDGKSQERQDRIESILGRFGESFNVEIGTLTPKQVKDYFTTLPFKERTKANHIGPDTVRMTALTNVVALSASYNCSIALLANGTVQTWGDNYFGQLGNGTNGNGTGSATPIPVAGLTNIVAVTGGDDNFLAFNRNGDLFVWGSGSDGELANGTENDTNVPTLISGISNVVAIAGGEISLLAMTANGKIYEWGTFQDMVFGPYTNYFIPFEVDLPALPLDDASNLTVYFPNQYVNTNVVTAFVAGGAAAGMAILVNNTNFASAQWTAFIPTPTVNLGTTDGVYQVWFGFQGQNGIAYWTMKSVTLDMTPPIVNIVAPGNNSSFDLSSINVQGNFVEANFKQLQVNGIQAFISGTNFTALNVPLSAETNVITAVAEDLAGNNGSNTIVVIGLTNADGSLDTPVVLQATPTAGFAQLIVTFQITSNAAPGTFSQVSYDFNGDGITDFVTNSLNPITYTYATNGEYFPVATIQTTAGTFSSSGGWNSTDPNRLQIAVQLPVTQIASFSVTDPVDIKWVTSTNLYILSGSTATLMETDTNGNVVRSISNLGSNPSGFAVDTNGDVYVAVTSSNQVWKFDPTTTSFAPDTNFGLGGYIGLANGMAGTNVGAFNAPFDIAVSPDNIEISVSDSGNNRVQQFDSSGNFQNSFGSSGNGVGQFNNPKGLCYDTANDLYVVDSGNGRIVLTQGSTFPGSSGTNGNSIGDFGAPCDISTGMRGIYVADTGNNRVQAFNPIVPQTPPTPFTPRFLLSTNLNAPESVAAVDDLQLEQFYVADTGNNRVVLYAVIGDDPTPAWTSMTNRIAAGDIAGAISNFSSSLADKYEHDFAALGTNALISAISQIGPLTPVFVNNDSAEYYFTQIIDGQTITFPIEFVKENGVWKIDSF